jgi:hypothetical protein
VLLPQLAESIKHYNEKPEDLEALCLKCHPEADEKGLTRTTIAAHMKPICTKNTVKAGDTTTLITKKSLKRGWNVSRKASGNWTTPKYSNCNLLSATRARMFVVPYYQAGNALNNSASKIAG